MVEEPYENVGEAYHETPPVSAVTEPAAVSPRLIEVNVLA